MKITKKAKEPSQWAQRLDLQKHQGETPQDPPHFITCYVKHPVKGFTVTFDPKILPKMREKYGKNLITNLVDTLTQTAQ
jgi:hypothetical protein